MAPTTTDDNSDPRIGSYNDVFYDSGSSSHTTEDYGRKSKRKLDTAKEERYHRKENLMNSAVWINDDEVSCAACGFEKTFVPEGMVFCSRCDVTQYCSIHCRDWDWSNGDHSKTCPGRHGELQQSKPHSVVPNNDNSVDADVTTLVTPDSTFDISQDDSSSSSSQGSMKVASIFDSDDPSPAPGYFTRTESKKILNKDDNPVSGTTSPVVVTTTKLVTKIKEDVSGFLQDKEQNVQQQKKDETSPGGTIVQVVVEHHDSTSTSELTRQSDTITQSLQHGVFAYDTYTQPLQSGHTRLVEELIEQDTSTDELTCKACGFEAEFVENGLVPCPHCKKPLYCSQECREWDWKRGSHSKTCPTVKPVIMQQQQQQQQHQQQQQRQHPLLQKQQSYRTRTMQQQHQSLSMRRQKSQKMLLSSSMHSAAYNTIPPKPGDDGHNSSLSSVDFSLAVDIVTRESMPLLGYVDRRAALSGKSVQTSKAPDSDRPIEINPPSKANSVDDTKLTDDLSKDNSRVVCAACGYDTDMVEDGIIPDPNGGSFVYCSKECCDWHLTQQITSHTGSTVPHNNMSSYNNSTGKLYNYHHQRRHHHHDNNDDNNNSNSKNDADDEHDVETDPDDTSLDYDDVQGIFVVQEGESKYRSPSSIKQPQHIESNKLSTISCLPTNVPVTSSNKIDIHSNNQHHFTSLTNDGELMMNEVNSCNIIGGIEIKVGENGMVRSSQDITFLFLFHGIS
jgi:rubrerythrin